MWNFKHSETTTATPEAIWQQWSHPELWSKQNKTLVWAKLEGPFSVGSKIIMKPRSGPQSTVTLTEVSRNKSFSAEGNIPFGKLIISHEINSQTSKSLKFTHSITVTGPLTFLFKKLFVSTMAKNLPGMMKNIAKFAEEK